jgi:hypothetical protein
VYFDSSEELPLEFDIDTMKTAVSLMS